MSIKTKQQLEQENKELLTLNSSLADIYNKLECENNALKQQIEDSQIVFSCKKKTSVEPVGREL
ncbi:MAG TPA: hypothetical protein VIK78_09105 [Ruminiclostridium sp.]